MLTDLCVCVREDVDKEDLIVDEHSNLTQTPAVQLVTHIHMHTHTCHHNTDRLIAGPLSHMPPKGLASAETQTHSNKRHILKSSLSLLFPIYLQTAERSQTLRSIPSSLHSQCLNSRFGTTNT